MTEYDGTPNDWIVCPRCKSDEATLTHKGFEYEVTVRCPDCGEEQIADWWNGVAEIVKFESGRKL